MGELKGMLEPKVGVPPPYQQLALDNCILDDQRTLRESAVTDRVELRLVVVTVPSSLSPELRDLVPPDDEVGAHARALAQMPWHTATPRAVADYLYDNRILLTSVQAARIFRLLVGKVVNKTPGRSVCNVRAQLILVLHSFVLDHTSVWEKDDGSDGCLWANMSCFQGRCVNSDPSNFSSVRRSPDEVSFDEVHFIRAFGNESWRS